MVDRAATPVAHKTSLRNGTKKRATEEPVLLASVSCLTGRARQLHTRRPLDGTKKRATEEPVLLAQCCRTLVADICDVLQRYTQSVFHCVHKGLVGVACDGEAVTRSACRRTAFLACPTGGQTRPRIILHRCLCEAQGFGSFCFEILIQGGSRSDPRDNLQHNH